MSYDHLLPPLCKRRHVEGDVMAYIDHLYDLFSADFIEDHPVYQDLPVGLIDKVEHDGKNHTFWHVIQGKDGVLVPARAERIRWVRALIEAADEEWVVCWIKQDARGDRVHLATADFDYVVVIEERKGYWILVTAYKAHGNHHRRKLRGYHESSPCP